ncbi:MAG: hypothetical protein R3F41_06465 [Gammaproteobacteria bacterium]|nr:hypothetical protein [Pseudomonadales bacterium]MCP5348559.1 hypothetical protein [Pseudomonadales bacterium]
MKRWQWVSFSFSFSNPTVLLLALSLGFATPRAGAAQPESLLLSAGELGISMLPVERLLERNAPSSEQGTGGTPGSAQEESASVVSREREQLAVIDALIQERGAYGTGLDEAYAEYGKLHLEVGNFQHAADQFRQAWHLSRINSGLYSEEQLAYLTALIEALVELERWDEVHDLHQLSFLIASRIYPADDIRYLIAAELYASWKWEAINSNFLTGGYARAFETAQQLSAFYTEVIEKVEHADGPHTSGLINLVAGKARTDITIARALVNSQSTGNALGPGSYVPETQCFTQVNGQSGAVRQCRQVRLALYDIEEGAVPPVHFALGRYLKQVNQSAERLERLQLSAELLTDDQRAWVDSLINTLHKESAALSRPGRRR